MAARVGLARALIHLASATSPGGAASLVAPEAAWAALLLHLLPRDEDRALSPSSRADLVALAGAVQIPARPNISTEEEQAKQESSALQEPIPVSQRSDLRWLPALLRSSVNEGQAALASLRAPPLQVRWLGSRV